MNILNTETNSKTKNQSSIQFESNIISFFISTTKAKIILARQFVSITKRDLFQLSFLFSRHIDHTSYNHKNNYNSDIENKKSSTLTSTSKNNFEVEELNYRFIYQSLYCTDLYIVLVTKIPFNIFQSIDLLKTLHRTISELADFKANQSQTLEGIIKNVKEIAYDAILAIDDIVNPINGKEEGNTSQVKINIKMESNEAKQFTVVQKEKEDKARDNIVKGIEEIEKLKRENKYISNSISSEMMGLDINKIGIVNSNEGEVTTNTNAIANGKSNTTTGMNLKERFIQRILQQKEEELRMQTYMFACNNIIQGLIVNEMKKQFESNNNNNNNNNNNDSDSEDNEYNIVSSGTLIFAPLHIMFESISDDDEDDN